MPGIVPYEDFYIELFLKLVKQALISITNKFIEPCKHSQQLSFLLNCIGQVKST